MKIQKYFLIILFLISADADAQASGSLNIDSIYNRYLQLRSRSIRAEAAPAVSSEPKMDNDEKCLTGLTCVLRSNFRRLAPRQQQVLRPLLDRPAECDTSFVTPKGYFRIHFSRSGKNAPAYDLEQFAAAADSVYDFEINTLGYPPPPKDFGAGGDDRYDIYLTDIGRGNYGVTEPETDDESKQTSPSFIKMNSDYTTGFITSGINAAKATIAHEFFHAVQFGGYNIDLWDSRYFFELSAAAMEHFVFDYIHDYYQYLKDYFSMPGRSFPKSPVYSLCIWNIYLKERFGFDILKRQWELHRQYDPMTAIELSLGEIGTSFLTELNRFGQWTYFTNYRTQKGKYFKDASNYPLLRETESFDFVHPSFRATVSQDLLSNKFLRFISIRNDGFPDTLCAIISNGDIPAWQTNPDLDEKFEYNLYDYNAPGAESFAGGYYKRLSSEYGRYFNESDILNCEPAGSSNTPVASLGQVYPAPFNYNKHRCLHFPVEFSPVKSAELTIYSISAGLVYTGRIPIEINNNKFELKWDGFDGRGKKLASGVYLYVTDSGGVLKKGKVAILN